MQTAAAPLTIVSGDSGAGKTALLGIAASDESTAAVHSSVITLQRRAGSLQLALMQALASILEARAAEEGSLERLSRMLARASTKVVEARLRDLAMGASAMLFGWVKDKLGDTVGCALEDLAHELATTSTDEFAARISAGADRDVVDTFLALAAEIQAYVGAPLVLSLDGAERLGEDDRRILLDIASAPLGPVRLRVALALASEDASAWALQLREVGAADVRLHGLDADAVSSWADDSGVPIDIGRMMRVTGGMPVYVDAALAHVSQGGELRELPIGESFQAQTEAAFHRLSRDARRACVVLSALSEPPNTDEIVELLGVEQDAWLQVRRDLEHARVLATTVDGLPWFHDLRRRAIWETVLNDDERRSAAHRVLEYVMDRSRADQVSVRHAVDLARLSCLDPVFCAENPGLQAVLEADVMELRILVSVMELVMPGDQQAIDAASALEHARETLGARGDLVAVLRGLVDRGLLVMAENEHAAVVIPAWSSAASLLACLGRGADELPRIPVPRLATAVFDSVLRSALGPFHSGHYGVGQPRVSGLGEMLRDLQMDRSGDTVTVRTLHGLTIRLRAQGVSVYGAIGFEDAADRDHALTQIRDAVDYQDSITLDALAPWPCDAPLPSSRFVDAWGLLTSTSRRANTPASSNSAEPVRDILERCRLLYTAIRNASDDTTRSALGLERPRGYVLSRSDRQLMYAEVSGLDRVIEVASAAVPTPFFGVQSPFVRVELAESAGLDGTQRVGVMHYRMGLDTDDLMAKVIEGTANDLKKFNQAQGLATQRPLLRLPARVQTIHEAVQGALDRLSADALAIAETGAVRPHSDFSPYRTMYLLVRVPPDEPSWVFGAHGSLTSTSAPATDRNSVHVIVETDADPEPRPFIEESQELARAFGLDPELDTWSSGDLISGLSELLGMGRDWSNQVRLEAG
ncbi:hypothetical protein SAMN05192575_107154 [Nocardioides alpinus]|nr:hypothetical protein SAMN05192575_107154 [Nocardioides alpinus]